MVEEVVEEKPRKRQRKTIGEEGSRKQTLIGLIITLVLALAFYLPRQLGDRFQGFKLDQGSESEVISITKPAATKIEVKQESEAEAIIESLIKDKSGDYGIYLESLSGEEKLGINENLVLSAASVIKLPILVAYYRAVDAGRINPSKTYVLQEQDRLVYGTGSLQNQPAGTEYSYQEVAELVANQSDNMGAQLLIKWLGGEASVERTVKGWGLTKTSLKEYETTASEIGQLWKKIYEPGWLKEASRESLKQSLTKTVLETRIPAGVPEGIRVRHKFGSETGVINDCGVVEAKTPYLLCLLSTGVNDGEAEELLVKISQTAWNWLGD